MPSSSPILTIFFLHTITTYYYSTITTTTAYLFEQQIIPQYDSMFYNSIVRPTTYQGNLVSITPNGQRMVTISRTNGEISTYKKLNNQTWVEEFPNAKTMINKTSFTPTSMALGGSSGTILVIGDSNYNSSFGLVLTLTYNGTQWIQNPTPISFTSIGTNTVAQQGRSIAISSDGTVLAFGAIGLDQYDGGVFVFGTSDSGTSWQQHQPAILKSSEIYSNPFGDGAKQGISVALNDNGNYLVYGAANDAGYYLNDYEQGAVYVFVRSNNGVTWIEQTRLVSSLTRCTYGFGFRVALNGNGSLLAVASPYDAHEDSLTANGPWYGAVIIFVRNGNNWDEVTKLEPQTEAGVPRPLCGESGFVMSKSGDRIFMLCSDGNFQIQVFQRDGNNAFTWSQLLLSTSELVQLPESISYPAAISWLATDGNGSMLATTSTASVSTAGTVGYYYYFLGSVRVWKYSLPTSAPSIAPTLSAPSKTPTVSHPSKSPSWSGPSTSPTTSKPSHSPVRSSVGGGNPVTTTQIPTLSSSANTNIVTIPAAIGGGVVGFFVMVASVVVLVRMNKCGRKKLASQQQQPTTSTISASAPLLLGGGRNQTSKFQQQDSVVLAEVVNDTVTPMFSNVPTGVVEDSSTKKLLSTVPIAESV
jgi:hypothetical protein